jgi:hypothetical protein
MVVQTYQNKEVICRQISQALLINMFCLRSCVLNALDGRSYSVQFRTLHKEDADRINFEGIFIDGDQKGKTFTGFFDANNCKPKIYF